MIETLDYNAMGPEDFKELDRRLSEKTDHDFLKTDHLVLLSVILHSSAMRREHESKVRSLNEPAALRFMKDHADLPLCTDTILAIYGSMLDHDKKAAFKSSNAYLKDGDSFYITLPYDETPKAMEELCTEYAFLNDPAPEQFDQIFHFLLRFICIHPFQDGNGRMFSLLFQFLLYKAGLSCALVLPLDFVVNGIYARRHTAEIRHASGMFYGEKELEYERYIIFMKEMLAKSYQIMLETAGRCASA